MPIQSNHAVMLASFSLAALAFATDMAAARGGDRDRGAATTCSRYGSDCISAQTRRGRLGREVRLPGGTWIDCKGDCRNTLREETIDFFETLRENAPDGGRR